MSDEIFNNKISYMRQTDLFNPVNQKFKIVIFGAGSLGSFITLNIAKLGFNDITVYDYDYVEEHNIPNQFYRMSDIGKQKVEALGEIIKQFADIEIEPKNEKVTSQTQLPLGLNNLYILTFDNLENRKIVYELVKESGSGYILDVRVGGEQLDIQSINLSNDEEVKKWGMSFNITENELPCGARSIIYTNLNVASEVCNIVKKINNGERYPTKLLRHMQTYRIINDLK